MDGHPPGNWSCHLGYQNLQRKNFNCQCRVWLDPGTGTISGERVISASQSRNGLFLTYTRCVDRRDDLVYSSTYMYTSVRTVVDRHLGLYAVGIVVLLDKRLYSWLSETCEMITSTCTARWPLRHAALSGNFRQIISQKRSIIAGEMYSTEWAVDHFHLGLTKICAKNDFSQPY